MFNLVIFDWKRTLYDPEVQTLTDGVMPLLNHFKKKNIKMVLVGKGGDDMRQEVERLGVKEFFSKIVFAEGEKDSNVFSRYIEDPQKTLFIGDRVRSELEIGKKLGAVTVWIRQGKFAKEEPANKDQEPDYIVNSLTECLNFLESTI